MHQSFVTKATILITSFVVISLFAPWRSSAVVVRSLISLVRLSPSLYPCSCHLSFPSLNMPIRSSDEKEQIGLFRGGVFCSKVTCPCLIKLNAIWLLHWVSIFTPMVQRDDEEEDVLYITPSLLHIFTVVLFPKSRCATPQLGSPP